MREDIFMVSCTFTPCRCREVGVVNAAAYGVPRAIILCTLNGYRVKFKMGAQYLYLIYANLPHPGVAGDVRRAWLVNNIKQQCGNLTGIVDASIPRVLLHNLYDDVADMLLTDSFFALR